MKRTDWPEIDAAILAGDRPRDICARFRVAASAVWRRGRELGIPPRPPGLRQGDRIKAPRSPITEVLIEQMVALGRTAHEAAREVGVSPSTASRARDRWIAGRRRLRRPCVRGSKTIVAWNGEELPLSEWSRRTGIAVDTLGYRLRSGWPIDRAMTAPVGSARHGAR